MAIEVKNLKALPNGQHTGIIVACAQVERDFGHGPEPSLEVVIQPKQPEDGVYNPLSVNYSVSVNPLSAFGKMLVAIRKAPNFAKDKVFQESSIVGVPVNFTIVQKNNFPAIVKDSIAAV